MFRTPRVHLQEEVCTYMYGVICVHAIGISNLVSGKVCSVLRSVLSP